MAESGLNAMIRFNFKIQTFPEEPTGYQVPAYTEGTLDVWLADSRFLHAEGILLVEFAIVLERWLRQVKMGAPCDLYYSSMDFEEQPILALEYDAKSGEYHPTAVWATGSPEPISSDEARRAAEDYIDRLGRELAEKHDVTLAEVLSASIEPDEEPR